MSTTYNGGFKSGVTVRGIPITQTHGGAVFWVSNAKKLQHNEKPGSDGNTGSFLDPFATLAKALSKCMSGRGDMIFVKQGHNETFSAPFSIDVDSVSIIGIGGKLDGPYFLMNDVSAGFVINADSVTLQNFRIPANLPNITQAITVNKKGFRLHDVMIYDYGSGTFIKGLVGANAGVMEIQGGEIYLNTSIAAIDLTVGSSYTKIKDINISGSYSTAAIFTASTVVHLDLQIINANIRNMHVTGGGIKIDSASDGMIRDSSIRTTTKGAEITTQTMDTVNCRGCSMDGCGDYVIPLNPLKGCTVTGPAVLLGNTKTLILNSTIPTVQILGGTIQVDWLGIEILTTNNAGTITATFVYVDTKTSTTTLLGIGTDIGSLLAGTIAVQPGTLTGSFVGTTKGVYSSVTTQNKLILMPGIVSLVNTTLAGSMGMTFKVHLKYTPLDPFTQVLMY